MVYKWHILPIGGLYGTYHLLREPGFTPLKLWCRNPSKREDGKFHESLPKGAKQSLNLAMSNWPSLKLTASLPLKIDDWNAFCPIGEAYFQLWVSVRVAIPGLLKNEKLFMKSCCLKTQPSPHKKKKKAPRLLFPPAVDGRNPAHQLKLVVNPIIHEGCKTSQKWWSRDFWTINSMVIGSWKT